MDPAYLYTRHRRPDIDDLAATFVEQEVGRYDWKNNWEAYKRKPNLTGRIQAWLDLLGVQTEASDLIRTVDELVNRRTGRWV